MIDLERLRRDILAHITREGLTPTEFAADAGISRGRVYGFMEEGGGDMKVQTLCKVAKAMGLTAPELLARNMKEE